jgi:Flp pilus assembly protein TadG
MPRPGTTMVETAFILVLALMFLFGIIEYGRLLLVRQVVDNAAREGARYAVVHVTEDNVEAATKAVVNQRMAGIQNSVQNYEVKVYKADNSGKSAGAANEAGFGVNIGVEISCDFDTILPSFLLMDNTIHIRAKVLMNSEAN